MLRQVAQRLSRTPVHPQWLILRHTDKQFQLLAAFAKGDVLDVGSGRQTIRPFLPSTCRYFPLDYFDTAIHYRYLPDIFADGQRLPIAGESIDTVLLLDVLEHLPDPHAAMAEVGRVLRGGGTAIIRVPFSYPLHDEPFDFQRWTKYGLHQLAERHSLSVVHLEGTGKPLETAAILLNIALSKMMLDWAKQRHPLLLLAPLLPSALFVINMIGWIGSKLPGSTEFMPQSYRLIVEKRE